MPISSKYLFGISIKTLCPICYWTERRMGHEGWVSGGIWRDLIDYRAPGCGHWECLGQYD